MDRKNPVYYLPVRAFGDFVITAAVVKDQFCEKIPILLPDYFQELFQAIGAEEYFEIAGTVPFCNQPIFFQLYTLSRRANWFQLKDDLHTIRAAVNMHDIFLLDYSSRRLRFTGAHFFWPDVKKNSYESKLELFSRFFDCKKNQPRSAAEITRPDNYARILILPDSRIRIKQIDNALVARLQDHFNDKVTDVASFSRAPISGGKLSYQNFGQLIRLIREYDLIIGAESLPYHLANYLGKAHFVIYNQSRHMKKTFMTPFMTKHHAYVMTDTISQQQVLVQIGKFLAQ